MMGRLAKQPHPLDGLATHRRNCFLLTTYGTSEGIRTHTTLVLSEMTAANWSTEAFKETLVAWEGFEPTLNSF